MEVSQKGDAWMVTSFPGQDHSFILFDGPEVDGYSRSLKNNWLHGCLPGIC